MRDYKVFFVSDATATFNTPEASADQIQPIVLATLKAAFAQIENTASMIRKLQNKKAQWPPKSEAIGAARGALVDGRRGRSLLTLHGRYISIIK